MTKQRKQVLLRKGKNEMARKNIIVTQESKTGRNLAFRDPTKKQDMSRAEFVKRIEKGEYDGYHIREINGIKTPASNPDGSEKNNLD